MAKSGLPVDVAYAIDFRTYVIPAERGLDVPPRAAAAMLDISEEQFHDYVAHVRNEVNASARELLTQGEIASAIDRIPVAPGETVMAVGDSMTVYRRGYAELLRAMLAERRSGDNIKFTNRARSGYTSVHARRTTYTQLLRQKPGLVLLLLGGNDCMRFGGESARTLVSLRDYRENMRDIVRALREHAAAQLVLISPAPVVESTVNRVANFRARQLTWANEDLQACADALQDLAAEFDLPFVNLMARFGLAPDRSMYVVDGVHLGPSGHRVVVQEVLRVW